MRVATIHRYKALESPVVVLCEIDGRVEEAELAGLLYVGATRARAYLALVVGAECDVVHAMAVRPSTTGSIG